jgi:sec-independent protein translocase protein TatC
MASGMDEDTARTLQRGRETLGATFSAAQSHLQKVFLVFVAGLLATIMLLQYGVWDALRRDLLFRKMGLSTAQETRIIAVTPFDVILLQIKIGLVIGILLALPPLIYYSRDGLRERGLWPTQRIPTWKLVSFATAITLLFVGGVLYAYELFFPLMFSFLAGNALQAGFLPHYSIVKWFQFVVLLGLSFGLAAQLPLMMTTLTYANIVSYETFRDKWKYAVVLIFGFGSIFSPPDPFTQIMWALPLCLLYVVSLGLSKLVTLLKRAGREIDWRAVARRRWNRLAAVAVLAGGGVYYVLATEAFASVRRGAELFPSRRLTGDVQPPSWFGLGVDGTALVIAVLVGTLVAVIALYYSLIQALNRAAAAAGNFGDPAEIDVGELSASAVRAAPPEAFDAMEESDALQLADEALQADEDEKADAILQRYDAAQERQRAAGEDTDAENAAEASDEDEAEGGIFASTAAGMADAFTEEETTEDDIGGYFYDFRFILDSVTSNWIWIVAVFLVVTGAAFVFLYAGIPGADAPAIAENASVTTADGEVLESGLAVMSRNVTALSADGTVVDESAVIAARDDHRGGRPINWVINDTSTTVISGATVTIADETAPDGTRVIASNATVLVEDEIVASSTSGIGIIKNTFVANLPPEMVEQVSFITLHPVEHLIFIVKVSTLLGAVAVLPMLLYAAWPALRERGFVGGGRNVLGVWAGTIGVTLVGGSIFGFLFVAPEVISWLAFDALESFMVISYRVAKFGWLVLALTIGIGLLIEIPVTMILFHRAGIVPFQTLQRRWRPIVMGVFAAGAVFSPKGIFTMFLLATPIALAFLAGMGILWLYTLGGRRQPRRGEPAD